jgi:hypothetical protein
MSLLQSHLRDEDQLFAKLDSTSEKGKARCAAFSYEDLLSDRYRDDPSFKVWNRNRALDIQNYDYLFWHRHNVNELTRTYLEIIAAKITHINQDDKDGYFKGLERNVNWTRHITPLLFSQYAYLDNLVRCGIWAHAKNSRRCHKPDYCSNCHWNDILKARVEAFGEDSGTFERMESQNLTATFITLGYTTQQANSKSVGRDFKGERIIVSGGSPEYDPYPVCLGFDDCDSTLPWLGYLDAKLLGLIAQQAMEHTYKEKLFAGYHFKIEGAFKLVPDGANRINLHAHSVANGPVDNPQFRADVLFKYMRQGLHRYRKHLRGDYYPDVLVERLESASDFQKCICYSEKVIPIGLIVGEAMGHPEAKLSDGRWNTEYISEVQTALMRLVNDDIPAILTALKRERLFQNLRRRKTVGNFTFNDRGTCIGDEPAWHKGLRRTKAKRDRATRLRRKARALKDASEASIGVKSWTSRKTLPARARPTQALTTDAVRSDTAGTQLTGKIKIASTDESHGLDSDKTVLAVVGQAPTRTMEL